MDNFIHHENIRRFKQLLLQCADESQRAVLKKLLEDACSKAVGPHQPIMRPKS